MIVPFLNFEGQAAAAIALYETVFDVQNKQVMYFNDLPPNADMPIPAEIQNYILHSEMTICGAKVWIGDSPEGGVVPGTMVSLSVTYTTVEEVEAAFYKLKEGGKIMIDLAPQFYSPMYAMIEDKFGVVWSLICQ
jgi:PhnB protein